MTRRSILLAPPVLTAITVAACGSGSAKTTPAATATTTRAVPVSAAAPPARPRGGGEGGSKATYSDIGAYTLSAGSGTFSARAFTASGTDEAGVLVTGTPAQLSLIRPVVRTSGNT